MDYPSAVDRLCRFDGGWDKGFQNGFTDRVVTVGTCMRIVPYSTAIEDMQIKVESTDI